MRGNKKVHRKGTLFDETGCLLLEKLAPQNAGTHTKHSRGWYSDCASPKFYWT